MSQRTERIDELLRQEIGLILAREAKDPRIGFATITDVETEPDLRHARVWVSVIGSEAERKETLEALRHAMHFVRRELGTRLRLRRIPDLHVRLDDSIERGSRVLHLLQELEEEGQVDEGSLQQDLPTPVRRLHREGDAPEEPADALPPIPPAPGAGMKPGRRRSGGTGASGGMGPRGGRGTGSRPGAGRGTGTRPGSGRGKPAR